MKMDKILSVNNINKVFNTKENNEFIGLIEVSFDLYRGEALGIVGESGSGKSTLVKIITRLIEPSEGSVIFRGEDITKKQGKSLKEVYKNMQMVFQLPQESFDPRKTIGQSIKEALLNFGTNKKEVDFKMMELLEICELEKGLHNRCPHELSGGQCQRAAIARALAPEPELLICDEATSALDVTVEKQILELLIKLKKEKNLSLLFICHDVALVEKICDNIIVMEKGNIVEMGNCQSIINSPKSEYTKRLIEAVL